MATDPTLDHGRTSDGSEASTTAMEATRGGTLAGVPGTRDCVALLGGRAAGGERLDLELVDGVIQRAGAFEDDDPALECETLVDVEGRWLAPAFIDSHVHLAYLPVAASLAAGGVAAAVDLAAPLAWLERAPTTPRVLAAGPMITAVGGYPTQSWGANGYGLECADAAEAVAAVDRLHARGAAVIKLPFDAGPSLPDDAVTAAIDRARHHGMRTIGHALDEVAVATAAAAGVDVLAHTPVGPLRTSTVQAWSDRAVITTLAAFGASATTVDNLATLRAAGALVLYGTDLGNAHDIGISAAELTAMGAAGMDGAAILAAGTADPARYWGLDELGALEVGKAASVLVLESDPIDDPLTLATPVMVFLDGERIDARGQ